MYEGESTSILCSVEQDCLYRIVLPTGFFSSWQQDEYPLVLVRLPEEWCVAAILSCNPVLVTPGDFSSTHLCPCVFALTKNMKNIMELMFSSVKLKQYKSNTVIRSI